MIVDNRSTHVRAGSLTRRRVLALAAAGFLAACAPEGATSTRAVRTAVPVPLAPVARITPANAARVAPLALLRPQDGRVRGAAWSPDGRTVAAGGSSNVHLWDAATGREVMLLRGHTDLIYALDWSVASGRLASASFDHSVRVWNTSRGTAELVLGGGTGDAPVYSVAWAPDGSRLAAGTRDGDVVLWDARTGTHLDTWSGPPRPPAKDPNNYAAWGVSWSPDGRRIISNRYDSLVLAWDAGSGKLLMVTPTDSQPNTVAWSPDGASFATTHDDGTTWIWDGTTYGARAVLHANVEAGWAYALAWSPDGSMLASSYEDGSLRLWDVGTSDLLAELAAHRSSVWGISWSLDGMCLASASDDTTVGLWGVR